MSSKYENKLLVWFKFENEISGDVLLEEHLLLAANQLGAWTQFLSHFGNCLIPLEVGDFGRKPTVVLKKYARGLIFKPQEILAYFQTHDEYDENYGLRIFFDSFYGFYHETLLVNAAFGKERWVMFAPQKGDEEVLFKKLDLAQFTRQKFVSWFTYGPILRVADSATEPGLQLMKMLYLKHLLYLITKWDYELLDPLALPVDRQLWRAGTLLFAVKKEAEQESMLVEFDAQCCRQAGIFVD